MNKTCVLLFSKNRPLQADLCLSGYFNHCVETWLTDDPDVYILYKADEKFQKSYDKLYEEYPRVHFIKENNFKQDLLNCVSKYEYVMFLCDDNLFTGHFSINEICELLNFHKDALGFSLRLGENTKYCYSLNQNQAIPQWQDSFDGKYQTIYKYNWTSAQYDFSYALDLSSSIYRIKDILFLLDRLEYRQTNNLEWVMYSNLWQFNSMVPNLLCYETSIAFCSPMNKVQTVNSNRTAMDSSYDVDNLLKVFENGYRIDWKQFDGFVSNSCHQEVDFLKELRYEK
jgi:hypothetical protein